MNEQILYDEIFKLLEKENTELEKLTGKGIFFAPELYIAFILGKKIKEKEQKIFGKQVEWLREVNFGNIGPTDLAFKTENEIYVFEIKLRETYFKYINDINKLNELDNNYKKYFLALVDTWESQLNDDKRIKKIEENSSSLQAINIKNFQTKQDRYDGNISCVVGLWRLD